MTESEFLALAETTLDAIETALERAASTHNLDVECSRTGNMLTIELADNSSKIIVNSQTPMREIWVAAKSGGFHYRREGDRWVDSRNGGELFAVLSKMCSEQAGVILTL